MYTSRITRAAPSAFVLLVDQSGSMRERVVFNGIDMTKAEAVALATNTLLAELVSRSRREDGVRDYFEVAVIGYGGRGVYPLLGLKSAATPIDMLSVSRLAVMNIPIRNYMRERLLPDGRSIITTWPRKFWVEPYAEGGTPMLKAMETAYGLLRKWCNAAGHKSSFPPVVINITDGEATDAFDAQLLEAAARLRSLSTSDGNALLLNIHITTGGAGVPILFPERAAEMSETGYGRLLFEMSSPLPACYNAVIAALKDRGEGAAISAAGEALYRGMSYNCPIADLLVMISIGTVSVNLIQ